MSADTSLTLHLLNTIEEVPSTDQSLSSSPNPGMHGNDSEDEEFVYPDVEEDAAAASSGSDELPGVAELEHEPDADNDAAEVFLYPGVAEGVEEASELEHVERVSNSTPPYEPEMEPELSPAPAAHPEPAVEASIPQASAPTPPPPVQEPAPKRHPSPAKLEAVQNAASSGDLVLLKQLFGNALHTEDIEPFALSNDASPRTGLTALHAAASRGRLEIVKWLMEECGAIPDIEDKEGETALHKAALHGHVSVVTYLLPDHADVQAQDNDGWTALHNACSKGYLDIVRWLCEHGGATAEHNGNPGVDIRSQGGWTPLMNAASKGHLPIVLYLLTKQSANPLIRNNWGETAYDVAAAVFEIWICEVLQKAEIEKWRGTTVPYNPLAVHTTVPLILHEHQRLDMRLKTLAVSGGYPKFSASGLGRHGRRAPFELKLPTMDETTGKKVLPAWRSDVHLPLRDEPFVLPTPGADNSQEGSERSHFWLSDWTLDVTHPGVDAEEGWQYAQSFDEADELWTAGQPLQLQRLLKGNGAVAAGLGGGGSARTNGSSRSRSGTTQAWVRRRRWVRVMRRRLDIPPLPFMQPDGAMYHLEADGALVPHQDNEDDHFDGAEGQELGFMPSHVLTSAQDYVARARYLAGSMGSDSDSVMENNSAVQARRAIAKLERASAELREGILGDDDADRKIQAEVLLNAYTRELERRRLAAGAQGLLVSDDNDDELDDDDSDEEFHYPGSGRDTPRPPSIRSMNTDYFGRAPSRGPTDLTPHLSQAPEFRVPTHEAPQKVLTPRWTTPTPYSLNAQWERDEAVSQCRGCNRRFNFITRRHCRRCGRIFCDRCSSYRALLDPSDIVHDPAWAESSQSTSSQRVCQPCHEVVTATVPNGLLSVRTNSIERIVVDHRRLSIPSPPNGHGQTSSQISDLADCPVCGANLADIGPAALQEAHVRNCLEGGSGTSPQTARYLVYGLPQESPLIGTECLICLEEFTKGSTVARLSCLCSFHHVCLASWLQRGRSCPVHAR